jgi:hypothetical protein
MRPVPDLDIIPAVIPPRAYSYADTKTYGNKLNVHTCVHARVVHSDPSVHVWSPPRDRAACRPGSQQLWGPGDGPEGLRDSGRGRLLIDLVYGINGTTQHRLLCPAPTPLVPFITLKHRNLSIAETSYPSASAVGVLVADPPCDRPSQQHSPLSQSDTVCQARSAHCVAMNSAKHADQLTPLHPQENHEAGRIIFSCVCYHGVCYIEDLEDGNPRTHEREFVCPAGACSHNRVLDPGTHFLHKRSPQSDYGG